MLIIVNLIVAFIIITVLSITLLSVIMLSIVMQSQNAVCSNKSVLILSIYLMSLQCWFFWAKYCYIVCHYADQGILKGEVSVYCWPPIWLVWNQLYDYWQFLFLFAKQTNPNLSNRRSMVHWYFPLLYSLCWYSLHWVSIWRVLPCWLLLSWVSLR